MRPRIVDHETLLVRVGGTQEVVTVFVRRGEAITDEEIAERLHSRRPWCNMRVSEILELIEGFDGYVPPQTRTYTSCDRYHLTLGL